MMYKREYEEYEENSVVFVNGGYLIHCFIKIREIQSKGSSASYFFATLVLHRVPGLKIDLLGCQHTAHSIQGGSRV